MPLSLIAACLWVLLGAVTAALPMRHQMIPGLTLLVTALPMVVWVGTENGWIWTAIALFAFASMFRRPLLYLLAKARGPVSEQAPERAER